MTFLVAAPTGDSDVNFYQNRRRLWNGERRLALSFFDGTWYAAIIADVSSSEAGNIRIL
jgi:hypothetical protein